MAINYKNYKKVDESMLKPVHKINYTEINTNDYKKRNSVSPIDKSKDISAIKVDNQNKAIPENPSHLDLFLNVLVKSLTTDERWKLFSLLMNTEYNEKHDPIDKNITEIVTKYKTENEMKESLDFEYFLWDFKNWKNYFIAMDKNKGKKD